MFVCVMFANHPTIVALHANSFCKCLRLLVLILLIMLCLQCASASLAPYVLLRCDRNHADFAHFRFINRQLLLKKVFLVKFSAKNQPGVPKDRPRGLSKSHHSNSPMMHFNPKLSHNFVTPFRDFSVSSMYLFHSSGLVLLWLSISVSTEDIKMFAKATATFVPIAVPCIWR